MKNVILLSLSWACIFSILVLYSCEKKEAIAIETETELPKLEKKYIIRLQWDPGHDENGFCVGALGMCHVEFCAFCCFDANDVRIPCSQHESPNFNSGIVNMDDVTGTGKITLYLNPAEEWMDDVITNQSDFPIIEDLVVAGQGITILKGDYPYNASLGEYGGYEIDVIEN